MNVVGNALLAASLALIAATSYAAPPPAGSEDDMLLSPYSQQIHDAARPAGGRCCDLADGTAVDARVGPVGWQVHFRNSRFPNAPQGWVDVPEDAVVHHWRNPSGIPIVWWYYGAIRCFAPAAGG